MMKHIKKHSLVSSLCSKPTKHQKRLLSESTAAENSTIKQRDIQIDDANTLKKVATLRPFSLGRQNLNQRLEEVFQLHKQESARKIKEEVNASRSRVLHKGSSSSSYDGKKVSTETLQRQCRKIFSRKTRTQGMNKTNTADFLKRSKTVTESYEMAEKQLAEQMISDGVKQQKQFRKTIQRFNSLIQKAAENYVKKNDINLKPKLLKESGVKGLVQQGQVCTRYKDQVYQHECYPKKRCMRLQVNKEDVYTFLKSTNKLINIERVNQKLQEYNESLRLKQIMSGAYRGRISSKRAKQILFNKYFRCSNKQRRDFLHSTIHNTDF